MELLPSNPPPCAYAPSPFFLSHQQRQHHCRPTVHKHPSHTVARQMEANGSGQKERRSANQALVIQCRVPQLKAVARKMNSNEQPSTNTSSSNSPRKCTRRTTRRTTIDKHHVITL
ncbi:Hypothetical predicted protein [Olea europaea subsp. europaea]|uniref:Uncharacterized protein n=1 Tax=Olea europaea subsp. europaea TaxID=158383 RepID=A0A8S0SBJ8_OLEEU|nr:Hypothetical predicted protein [Olea europaea subsp. europaea]